MTTPPRHELRIQVVRAGTKQRIETREGEVLVLVRGGGTLHADRDVVVVRMKASVEASKGAVEQALTLMQSEPAERWTVERVARAVGLSRAVFARRFEAVTGTTPMRYLARCRMLLAAELLRETGEGLAQIAGAVGYDSEFAFSRAFKRQHGVPPGAFRRARSAGSITMMRAA